MNFLFALVFFCVLYVIYDAMYAYITGSDFFQTKSLKYNIIRLIIVTIFGISIFNIFGFKYY